MLKWLLIYFAFDKEQLVEQIGFRQGANARRNWILPTTPTFSNNWNKKIGIKYSAFDAYKIVLIVVINRGTTIHIKNLQKLTLEVSFNPSYLWDFFNTRSKLNTIWTSLKEQVQYIWSLRTTIPSVIFIFTTIYGEISKNTRGFCV